jgi:hypothetical protein
LASEKALNNCKDRKQLDATRNHYYRHESEVTKQERSKLDDLHTKLRPGLPEDARETTPSAN